MTKELDDMKKNLEQQAQQTEQQRLKAEQQLNEQMEQLKKLSDEDKAKMEILVSYFNVIHAWCFSFRYFAFSFKSSSQCCTRQLRGRKVSYTVFL